MHKNRIWLLNFLWLAAILNANTPEIIHETLYVHQQQIENPIDQVKSEADDIIVIWVHGTNSFQWFKKLFIHHFFYTKLGMHNISKIPANVQLSKIADTLAKADPVHFKLKNMYVFGWSGALSAEARDQAGKDLTKAVKKLVNDYRAVHGGKDPKIYIITHSHGGNVALNMVHDVDIPPITRLIMLAAPSQELTSQKVKDTLLFEEVYSIYSSKDLMQVMDPQYISTGRGTTFSKRIFPHQENVVQAEVTIDGKSPRHIDFIFLPFVSYLPKIVQQMHSWRENGGNQEEKRHVVDVCTAA